MFAVLLGFPAYSQEAPEWFTESFLDIPEDIAEAAKEGKRLMLYFSQAGCPYCKQLVTVNFRDPKIVEKTRRHFVAQAINIWGDREVTWYGSTNRKMTEKQFARMLQIQFTPTLIFFNEKGGVALRLNGYLPPEQFYTALDAAIGQAPAASSRASSPTARVKPLNLRRKPEAKPFAVLLLSPGCDACDEMERNLELEAVRAQLAHFELIKTSNPARVVTNSGEALLESRYVPALVFLDPRGREVFRTEAYLRPFHLAGSLEYVASGAYRQEPSFQRFLQAKAERMMKRGERVDLWN
jgi:thioredoxin-related protein